jgi:endonuclease/exonuclease/phosphatase family metal-dependent hydrolase
MMPLVSNERQGAVVATAVALALVLGLQCERVFVPTMIFDVDQSNRFELARNAVGVFLMIVFGAALVRASGPRQAALVSALVLAVCRIIVQFSGSPPVRWQVAALGLIAFGWFLIAVSAEYRDALAFGLGLGLWLDVILRAWYDTIDLPYMAGSSKHGVTLLLVAGLMLATTLLPLAGEAFEPDWLDALPLIGIGAGISCYALIGGNLGLSAMRTGGDLQYSLWLLSLGPVIALALWLFPIQFNWELDGFASSVPLAAVIAAGAGVAGLGMIAQPVASERWAALAIVMFGFGSVYLTMLAARTRSAPNHHAGVWRSGVLITLGMLIHAAMVFLYFASSGSFRFAAVAFLLLATLGIYSAWEPAWSIAPDSSRYVLPAGVVSVAFLMALLATELEIPGGTAAQLDRELTVVSYNIQNGFSRDNDWDLDATARTIEGLEPDVVLLQETGRGWFAMGWADQAWWLSQRLDMVMAFGPASSDDLWGNAILSRTPLFDVDVRKFSSSENLNRSVVSAIVPVEGGELWVASTHLDNPGDAEEVRMDQTTQLLEHWAGAEPAIIGGDFNATPDTDVVSTITGAGFFDTSAVVDNDETTSENGRKIDYIFVTPDLETLSLSIPDVWTSDHRPIAATVQLVGD